MNTSAPPPNIIPITFKALTATNHPEIYITLYKVIIIEPFSSILSCHTKFIYLRLYYYHWVDTSVGGLLVPDGIINPVVSYLALIRFIRYIDV